MLKALELPKLWKKSSFKEPGASYKQNTVSRDSLKNFLLHRISLLKAPIFKNSHFVAKIYFIFLKTRPWSNFKDLQYQIWTSVKGLRVTKIVKQIKFEGTWGKLEAQYCFQRQPWPKYMRQTLVVVLTKFSF